MKEQNSSQHYNNLCFESHGNINHPALILIAGISAQLIWWHPSLIQQLISLDLRVIIFDHRDIGLSKYFDHLDTPSITDAVSAIQQGKEPNPPYRLQDMANDIAELMQHLSIKKAHVLGMSMGGIIAQQLAIHHPDKILSLNCCASSSGDPGLPEPSPEVMQFFFNSPANENRQQQITRHIEQYRVYNHPEDFNLEAITQQHEKAYNRAYHKTGNQRHLLAMIAEKPRGDKLKTLHIPSNIIHGSDDPVVPIEHAKQLAHCIRNSQLYVIPNMGHALPKKAYSTILSALRRVMKK